MACEKTMDKIVALCKGRGFVYPGSEIYGGLAPSIPAKKCKIRKKFMTNLFFNRGPCAIM